MSACMCICMCVCIYGNELSWSEEGVVSVSVSVQFSPTHPMHCVRVYTCVCIWVCMYVCVYIYMGMSSAAVV